MLSRGVVVQARQQGRGACPHVDGRATSQLDGRGEVVGRGARSRGPPLPGWSESAVDDVRLAERFGDVGQLGRQQPGPAKMRQGPCAAPQAPPAANHALQAIARLWSFGVSCDHSGTTTSPGAHTVASGPVSSSAGRPLPALTALPGRHQRAARARASDDCTARPGGAAASFGTTGTTSTGKSVLTRTVFPPRRDRSAPSRWCIFTNVVTPTASLTFSTRFAAPSGRTH